MLGTMPESRNCSQSGGIRYYVVWEFPKTETWICVRLLVESGALRRRDLESCSAHKWGQARFVSTGYQKGFNKRYFRPFPGFSAIYVQSIYGDWPTASIRGSCSRGQKKKKKKKEGTGRLSRRCCLEKNLQLRGCSGCLFRRVVPSETPESSVRCTISLAKSCFYQSNEPEEAGNYRHPCHSCVYSGKLQLKGYWEGY